MTSFEERISRIAKNWVKAIEDRKPPHEIRSDDIDGSGDNLDHVVLTVWHPDLRDGRVMNLMVQGLDCEKSLVGLANLNLHIFPRGATLNERFRAYARRSGCTELKIDIKEDGEPLVWDRGTGQLTISMEIWNLLSPSGMVSEFRDDAIRNLDVDVIESPDKVLNWAIEHARPIRTVAGRWLRTKRGEALDKIAEKGALPALCQATGDLSMDDDLERTGASPQTVSIGHHIELLDLFIAFIQALAHYRPNAKAFRAALYQPEINDNERENCCCSLILV